MNNKKIRYFIDERAKIFEKDQLEGIYNLIMQKPFGDYEEMCLDLKKYNYVPFDPNEFKKQLFNKKEFMICIRSKTTKIDFEGKINIKLTSNKNKNYLTLLLDFNDSDNLKMQDLFYDFIISVSKLFKNIRRGITQAVTFNYENYYKQHKLKPVSPCFESYVHWIHIIGKKDYEVYGFNKKDLLNTPAYRVNEWENDTIFIQCYKDAFSYNNAETVKIISNINDHLLKICTLKSW